MAIREVKNTNLRAAKISKNDEFYTQSSDIEEELQHYKEHFEGKSVFLNCDDPEWSNFWMYFKAKFEVLGLRKLTATYFDNANPAFKLEMFDQNNIVKTPLLQNGDFRSDESINTLKESDIVVTNPPFSLFREYIAQLMEHDKKFIVLGSQNAITYKEIFPLIKDNKIWLGVNNGSKKYKLGGDPSKYPSNVFYEEGVPYAKLGNTSWFTNLDHSKRLENIPLFRSYDPETNPKYDNYDAIEVSKVSDIPEDYEGMMGVPITFLTKHNPSQFEIVGIAKRGAGDPSLRSKVYCKEDYKNYSDLNAGPVIDVGGVLRNTYPRILVKLK